MRFLGLCETTTNSTAVICLWVDVGRFKGHRAKQPRFNWFVAWCASPVLPSSMVDWTLLFHAATSRCVSGETSNIVS
jgi:hypothetical protein